MPKCLQILRHKKRSPLLSRKCCQVWRFSPRFEEFTLMMGNFSSDLEKFVSNLNFKRNKFIYVWGILRVFLILDQPTWQHCFPGSAVVVTMFFSGWSKNEASFSLLFVASREGGLLFDAQKGEKPSMFLASDVVKRHFGVHTESQESSSLPVAKHFLRLCLTKRRL